MTSLSPAAQNLNWLVTNFVDRVPGVLATLGIVLGAMYLLYMLQRTIFGPIKRPALEEANDAGPVEMAAIVPLTVLLVILGVFPSLLINVQRPAVELVLVAIGGS